MRRPKPIHPAAYRASTGTLSRTDWSANKLAATTPTPRVAVKAITHKGSMRRRCRATAAVTPDEGHQHADREGDPADVRAHPVVGLANSSSGVRIPFVLQEYTVELHDVPSQEQTDSDGSNTETRSHRPLGNHERPGRRQQGDQKQQERSSKKAVVPVIVQQAEPLQHRSRN